MAPSGRRWYVLCLAVIAIVGGSSALIVPTPDAHTIPLVPAATPPCPFITGSSPQTLSTTPSPIPLNPCPGVVVGTYLGGQGMDYARGIVVDESGYAYVVGTTNSTDFPTTLDAYDPTFNGAPGEYLPDFGWIPNEDVFLSKFTPTGALVFSTFFGGTARDIASSIAIDASGYIYLAGSTMSPDFPTTQGAYDRTLGYGGPDAFVAKFGPTGSPVFSTLLGGSTGDYADHGMAIAVDASGHAYVTGWTETYDFPITPGTFASEGAAGVGQFGVFVVKLNPEGSDLSFSTVIGGSQQDWSRAIAVDSEGDVFVAGETLSRDFPTTQGAFDTTPAYEDGGFTTWDAFVFKLSPDAGDLIYSTYLGGEGYDQAFAIATDSEGNAHVAGGTSAIDFPTTAGAYDGTFNGVEPGIEDAFVLGMSPAGDLLYSTFLGAAASDTAWGIYLDDADTIHVAGGTASEAFPTSLGAFDATYNGFADAFVAKLERNGSGLNYSTFLGGGDEVLYEPADRWSFCQGPCEDLGRSLAVDSTGNTTVVGGTTSPDFPTTENAFDPTYNGQVDAFLIRIELVPEPNRPPVAYFDVTASPEGDGLVYVNATHSADAEDADDLLEVRWDWEDDAGWDTAWSASKTTSHEYTWGGTYTIRLEVRDTGGLSGNATRQVAAIGPPMPLSADVSANPTMGVVPLTVSFWAAIHGGEGPYSYLWDFGDGATTTAPNPIHTFDAPGTYTIALTVTDSRDQAITESIQVVAGESALEGSGVEVPLWAVSAASAATVLVAGALLWLRRRAGRGRPPS